MASELICLDSSVLIDYFRKTKKENSFLFQLTQQNYVFAVSVITKFEVYSGSTDNQIPFWNSIFTNFKIIPFDESANEKAIEIYKDLKKRNKLIEIADLLIGATAKAHHLKLATLNKKHFERIDDLTLLL
jgi:tRNA(fMet)-specific endonuclease VapC